MSDIPPKYDQTTGLDAVPLHESTAPTEPPTQPTATGMPTLVQPENGGVSCATPYDVACTGAQPASNKIDDMVQKAIAVDIPQWKERIELALGQPCQLNVPIDRLMQSVGPDVKLQTKALEALLAGPQSVVNKGLAVAKMESTLPAIEVLVRVLEIVCEDAGVRGDIAAKIHRIEFTTQGAMADVESKSFSLVGGDCLLYNGVLAQGFPGIFTKKDILAFFEAEFYAQERALVTKFIYYGLPEATRRIQAAFGTSVQVNCDIVTMLGACTTQQDRLPTARTFITRTKLAQKATVTATNTFNLLANKAQALANRAQDKPPPEPMSEPEKEPHNSPNVLLPLVEAIELVCSRHESVVTSISEAISSIDITMIPGPSLVAALGLHQEAGDTPSPVILPDPSAATPALKNGVLLYQGCFEAGFKGCFSKSEIIDFFESHFRCREIGFVHDLMDNAVPQANSALTQVFGKQIEIEVLWPSIFPDGSPMKTRLDTADMLCGENSKFVIQPMVQAIQTVMQKFDESVPAMELAAGPPQNPIKTRICRIKIQGASGLMKAAMSIQPLNQGTDISSVLVYTLALDRGLRGCYDFVDFKSDLRKLFGIATPKDESGIMGGMEKLDSTVSRLGKDMSKKLGSLTKMKFW
eukprot:m.35451 g.35451  ORF g.35451 m.35451 type:complete len:638 (+) comp17141_c0_seq1:167-2080(+)